MNKQRRKQLADIVEQLESLKSELEEVKEQEEEAFENMPESLQESDRGQHMQEVIDILDNAFSSIEEAIDGITEAQE